MSDFPFIDFEDRWVVLTGASSGIGRAIACELARRGGRVVLMGRDEGRLADSTSMLPPERTRVVALDLRDTQAIAPCVRDLSRELGRLYGFCHCAGVVETRPLAALQPEALRSMMEVNVTAGLELARTLSRRDVMTAGEGALLFIASIYGWIGMPGEIGYSASKGAILSAARAMAVELARRRIRVNTLSPGLVHTPMTQGAFAALSPAQVSELESNHPLGPGKPEDVARAAVFLLAPQSRWITGTDLTVDGGYTAR